MKKISNKIDELLKKLIKNIFLNKLINPQQHLIIPLIPFLFFDKLLSKSKYMSQTLLSWLKLLYLSSSLINKIKDRFIKNM